MLNVLKIICWDVQHGNAMFIQTAESHNIIFDLGKGSYSSRNERFSPITHMIKKYKLKKVDLLIITHPHKDHIEDILSLKGMTIDQVILPNHLYKKDYLTDRIRSVDKPIFNEYNRLSKDAGAIENIKLGEVSFDFFYPNTSSRSRLNDHSLVTIISYLKFKFILMGDNESQSQRLLLVTKRFKRLSKNCNILLAPHHGRRDGFYLEMVEHLKPDITIVSDGIPKHTSVREKYARFSTGIEVRSKNGPRRKRRVLSTNRDGVIKIEAGIYKSEPSLKITTKSVSI